MKIAFAYWHTRIAPVFDSARDFLLIETGDGMEVSEQRVSFTGSTNSEKVSWLSGLGINTVVCGAITRQFEGLMTAQGLSVISFIAGELQDVVNAWNVGNIGSASLVMPGCCGQRLRRQRNKRCRRFGSVGGKCNRAPRLLEDTQCQEEMEPDPEE